MSKFLALLRYLALYLLITLTGGAIGAWWSIRSVSEPWGGDGIGVRIFGFLGILVGAMVGYMLVLFLISRRREISLNSTSGSRGSVT